VFRAPGARRHIDNGDARVARLGVQPECCAGRLPRSEIETGNHKIRRCGADQTIPRPHAGSVSARASNYNRTGTSSLLRGRQDADHREGAGEDMQAAVAGGNMLVTV
jgi:hypothetical protein